MPAPSATSLIDRVDDNDQPVGVVERREVFRERAGFRVAHVFVFNDVGRVLLQRVGRSGTRSPMLYGSSVAGYLFAGESYLEAAQRRLREELMLESPLSTVGSVRMNDRGSTKFIRLFRTIGDNPVIGDLGFPPNRGGSRLVD
jgi:isopentenyldiphosphate isomerase